MGHYGTRPLTEPPLKVELSRRCSIDTYEISPIPEITLIPTYIHRKGWNNGTRQNIVVGFVGVHLSSLCILIKPANEYLVICFIPSPLLEFYHL